MISLGVALIAILSLALAVAGFLVGYGIGSAHGAHDVLEEFNRRGRRSHL